MREVVFDTETTGLEPSAGDRIVEVGCVELINYLPTGREFQIYINPGTASSARRRCASPASPTKPCAASRRFRIRMSSTG